MRVVGYESRVLRGESGFTLPELLATIVILGVLLVIVVVIILGILEQRRVDAATRQFASDLRLAHVRATNELTDWRVIAVLERGDRDLGPDYYVVKLERPYRGRGTPLFERVRPKFLPGNVAFKGVVSDSGIVADDHSAGYWKEPWGGEPEDHPPTRTFEVNPDGTSVVYGGVNGSICLTVDGRPQNRVSLVSGTSRDLTESDSSCNTKTGGG